MLVGETPATVCRKTTALVTPSALPTTRSVLPSLLKSPAAKETPAPTGAGYINGLAKVPSPLPKYTLMKYDEDEYESRATSSFPSPLKSPRTMVPAVFTGLEQVAGLKVPSPLPS